MYVASIDGCPYGWVMVSYYQGHYSISIHKQIKEIVNDESFPERILIDMPMGLATPTHPRSIDQTLRREMGKRSSTVFNTPCKAAVYEDDFTKAKQLNFKEEGKSLSIQSLNIKSKIKQLDVFLNQHRGKIEFIESHPELCFKYFNKGIVETKKSTEQGRNERLEILSQYDDTILKVYNTGIAQYKRKDVRPDDLIDALCLCLANHMAKKNGFSFITDDYTFSEDGLPYKVAYWEP